MHCNPGIGMSHDSHNCREVPCLLQDAGSEIMPGRIEHEILRKARCFPRRSKLLVQCSEVPCCGVRWKYPSLAPLTAADHEHIQNAITHRNVTPSGGGLAIWNDIVRVFQSRFSMRIRNSSFRLRMPVSRIRMITSRSGWRAYARSLRSASSSKRIERPSSFINLIRGTPPISPHAIRFLSPVAHGSGSRKTKNSLAIRNCQSEQL